MNKVFLVSILLSAHAIAQVSGAGRVGGTGTQLFVPNAISATYQALPSDFQFCKTIPIASGTFTVTLVASMSQPLSGQCVEFLNYGSGVVTVAASGQNINGSATSQTIAAGSASSPTGLRIVSDGTNYFAQAMGAGGGGPSNCCGIPSMSTLGSAVGAALASDGSSLFSATKQTCSATTKTFWPIAGWFVSPTVTVSATQVSSGTVFPFTNCGSVGTVPALVGQGVLTTSLMSAGSAIDTYQYDGWHAGVGSQIGLGELTVTSPTGMSAAFIPDSGAAVSVVGTSIQVALTASSTQFLGFGATTYSTTELPVAIPVPYAGTFQYFTMCDTTNPTASVAVNFRDNGANVGTPGNIGFTLPASSAGCNGWDPTNTFAASAGDYVDMQTVSGATTQTTITWAAITLTATTGAPEWMWGLIDNTVSTTTVYSEPFMLNTSATIANTQIAVPRACTASNLYVVQATANGATPVTTFTLVQNGTATALTGTVNQASGTGSLLIDNTHTVSLAAGDRIQLSYVVQSGTSGTIGGWAFKCQ